MYKKNLATYNKKTGKFSVDKINTLKHAMDKIRLTVFYIYDNKIIEEEINKTRKKFEIPDNFFEDYKININSNKILVLLAKMILEWHKKILKGKNGKRIIELDAQIFNNNNFDKYSHKQINLKLWRLIIGAKFFEIPQKRLLGCMSNMLDYYFPTVNNDLQIQTYESTTINEIKFVWSDIEEKQNIKKQHKKKKGKFEYPNYGRDKMAYKLSLNKMTLKNISKKLNQSFEKVCGYADVPKFINKYKEFIEEIW